MEKYYTKKNVPFGANCGNWKNLTWFRLTFQKTKRLLRKNWRIAILVAIFYIATPIATIVYSLKVRTEKAAFAIFPQAPLPACILIVTLNMLTADSFQRLFSWFNNTVVVRLWLLFTPLLDYFFVVSESIFAQYFVKMPRTSSKPRKSKFQGESTALNEQENRRDAYTIKLWIFLWRSRSKISRSITLC